MKRLTLSMAAIAVLTPFSWARAELSYSYVHATAVVSEADTALGEEDGTGPAIDVSYEVLPWLHVFGGYKLIELDDLPLETETAHVGVGFNLDLTPDQSVFFDFSAGTVDVELVDPVLGTLTGDDDAYGFAIGYRERNTTRMEFTVSANYMELDMADTSDSFLKMSLEYEIKRRFKVLGGVTFGGEDSSWNVGVRYYLRSPHSDL